MQESDFERFFKAVEAVESEPDDVKVLEEPAEIWNILFRELPQDPISHIFSFSAFDELAIYCTVCKSWNTTITTCNRLWLDLCTAYWNGKYVPLQYRRMLTISTNILRTDSTTLSTKTQQEALHQLQSRRISVSVSDDDGRRSKRPCLRRQSHSLDSADLPCDDDESEEVIYFSDPDSESTVNVNQSEHSLPSLEDEDVEMKDKEEVMMIEECIARKAFRLAFMDRLRTTITIDELVSFRWYFRFKEQAGESWMEMDPWWNLNDNDFEIPSDDNRESEAPQSMMTSIVAAPNSKSVHIGSLESDDDKDNGDVDDGDNREHGDDGDEEKGNVVLDLDAMRVRTEHEHRLSRCTRVQFERDGTLQRHRVRKIPGIAFHSMRWKFGGTFWKRRLYGEAVQVNQYPSYWITRHPVHWGWVMQSMWVIYTSFAMPMMDSIDDQMIQKEDFGEKGFIEMMQYNVMGGVTAINGDLEEDDHPELMDQEGTVDLEKLRAVWTRKKRDDKRRDAMDFQQYLMMLQDEEDVTSQEEDNGDP